MILELKEKIDKNVENQEKYFLDNDMGDIDCWTFPRAKEENVYDEPLAIFKNKSRLYEKFEDFVRTIKAGYGVVIAGCKFD